MVAFVIAGPFCEADLAAGRGQSRARRGGLHGIRTAPGARGQRRQPAGGVGKNLKLIHQLPGLD